MTFPHLYHVVMALLVVLGVSYVVTGARVGYPLRFFGCFILKKLHLKFLWPLLQCPPCNSWWAGLLFGLLLWPWPIALAFAFASCGFVAVVNYALSGQLAAGEDFDALFEKGSEDS